MPTFAGLLNQFEGAGGLDTLFGHRTYDGYTPSQMTLAELDDFGTNVYGPDVTDELGYKATPVGFAQIVGTTRRNLAKQLGLSPDTVFDEDTQRLMTRTLLDETGGDPTKLRGTWEGFKHVSDEDLAKAWADYQNTGTIGALGTPSNVTKHASINTDGSISRNKGVNHNASANNGGEKTVSKDEGPAYKELPFGIASGAQAGLAEAIGDERMAGLGRGLFGLSQQIMDGGLF